MLTFFNNAAEDLAHTIINLQEKKYSHLRGTHLMTATSLNYIDSVLLPVLTSLFDHLAAYDYGADLIRKHFSVSCSNQFLMSKVATFHLSCPLCYS